MKYQIKKLRKNKIIIYKGLTIVDILFLGIIIAIASLPIIFIQENWILKISLFFIISLFSVPLLFKYRKHQAKGYQILIRMFKFVSSNKKYKRIKSKNKKGNIENIIPYSKKGKIGIINKDNKSVFGALKIFGKNITSESKNDQLVLMRNLTDFFNKIKMKATIVKLPVKEDLSKNLNSIKNNKENYINLSKFYDEWNREIKDDFSEKLKSEYYLIIYEKDEDKLKSEMNDLSRELNNCKISSEILNIQELTKLINEIYIHNPNFNFSLFEKENKILDINKVNFKKDYFKIDGNFYSTQTIHEYATLLKNDWIWKIFNTPSVVIWHINTIDIESFLNNINRTEINAEMNAFEEKNRPKSRKMNQEIEAIKEIVDSAMSGQENIVESTIIFLTKATNLQTIKKVKTINERNLSSINSKIDNLIYRQFEGFSASLFIKNDLLKEFQEQAVSNISYGWPFVIEEFNDGTFPITGIDKNNNVPIFFDPRLKKSDRTNHNMFIFGEPGKGKTTFTKKIMLSNLAKGDEIILIDTQNEFTDFVEKLNGQMINLGSDNEIVINPLQIRNFWNPRPLTEEEYKFNNESLLIQQENFMEVWLKLLYGDKLGVNERDMIIYYLKDLYKSLGFYDTNENLSQLPNEKYPIVSDLIKHIQKGMKKSNIAFDNKTKINVLRTLKLDFENNGKFAKSFNNHSTLELNNKVICFNISSLINSENKNLLDSYFYLLVSYLQGKISLQSDKQNFIWLVFDEFHKYVKSDNMMIFNFIYSMAKEGRKFRSNCILTTQQVHDLTRTDALASMGRSIIESCQYLVLFSIKADSLSKIDSFFSSIGGLSENEKSNISLFRQGECLLIVSPLRRFQIKVNYNQLEQEFFFKKNQQSQ
ncbi:Mbov_0397 family ICE element conjugal transfer ATPase [Mesomycoplasma lagogenitalium]|uniref:Type IV secretion system DNA-binding domain-containing protein n=1 Tax=Mesomycoplasma lagogenitalium TaxID=171286 RepID=A0ABY8LUK1_9BACT|nr:type IV secretion system DNA-binding domain-containing protein [Mesomycoplasma lagogenitalium]WGI36925.1 type IV secretion system DNA-binding domain-containing protein [Mesomycoplasma lagogenitalium]